MWKTLRNWGVEKLDVPVTEEEVFDLANDVSQGVVGMAAVSHENVESIKGIRIEQDLFQTQLLGHF